MLNGALKDYNFAARVRGRGLRSTQFLLTPNPNVTYSACMISKVEEMMSTRKAPYPVERTLLTSGILEACLTSKLENHRRLKTPHLSSLLPPPSRPPIPDRLPLRPAPFAPNFRM